MDYYIGVISAGYKGYAVGIYSKGHAIFDSSSFEPNFPNVIRKLAKLALDHPEAFENVHIHIDSPNLSGEEDAIKGLQKLVQQSLVEKI